MKAYREKRVYLHSFLTSTLDGGEWSASGLGSLTLGDIVSSNSIEILGGPKKQIRFLEKKNNLLSLTEIIAVHPCNENSCDSEPNTIKSQLSPFSFITEHSK
jgi:hypothetical protein